MKFLATMFSEHSGKPSMSRMLSAFVCVAVIGCWASVSVHRWELQPLSPEQVMMVLGAMGLKVLQRSKEPNAVSKPGDNHEPKVTTP